MYTAEEITDQSFGIVYTIEFMSLEMNITNGCLQYVANTMQKVATP